MNVDLKSLVGRDHDKAFAMRQELVMELAGRLPGLPASGTTCLTLLAGAGTRWVKSLAAAKERYANSQGDPEIRTILDFPPDAPRGLFPVRNHISAVPAKIPLAAYALDAFRNLGRHAIVVRGWEDEISESVLRPLGIDEKAVSFCRQKEGPGGKVLGHGDAAWQAEDLWISSRYVIVNFGGDANSPLTALGGLLALAALDEMGDDAELLLPVARIRNPAYPAVLDEDGLPRAFGHNKLGGSGGNPAGPAAADGYAYTNVGIRVYRTTALAGGIEEIRRDYWREESGYSIPGNDPAAHEFALDNVDALIAGRKKARILAIARPEELTPAKSFDEIGQFEEAVRKVRAEWDSFRSALDAKNPPKPWAGKGIQDS